MIPPINDIKSAYYDDNKSQKRPSFEEIAAIKGQLKSMRTTSDYASYGALLLCFYNVWINSERTMSLLRGRKLKNHSHTFSGAILCFAFVFTMDLKTCAKNLKKNYTQGRMGRPTPPGQSYQEFERQLLNNAYQDTYLGMIRGIFQKKQS